MKEKKGFHKDVSRATHGIPSNAAVTTQGIRMEDRGTLCRVPSFEGNVLDSSVGLDPAMSEVRFPYLAC